MTTFWVVLCFFVYVNTELGGHSILALASSHPQDSLGGQPSTEEDGMPPEMLQELLWFFRREDSTTWNYCILGLSLLSLVIGISLLGKTITANRNRKLELLQRRQYESNQPKEAEMKEAFVTLQEDDKADPDSKDSLPKVQNAGQVMVQWRDGNVTTLFPEVNEEDA